ncbi:MAG: peptidylprolyl isomerase [Candidatus Marinimicrobia bacterium]|nr:peptidylprolyl isomerase [Candidatus Neomarinimicrobiota bacterium]
MKYFQLISIVIFSLFVACTSSDVIVATIQSEKIHLSEIYQSIDETAFRALTPSQKTAFVRKYAIQKHLSANPQNELAKIGFFVKEEKNRLRHDLIVEKVEKYLANKLDISDSTLEFISNALNTDIYVKGLTVTHRFSFGKAQDRTKTAALKKAEKIYMRLQSGELTFDEAMSIYGESQVSKIKGNEMGQIYFGLMSKNFNDVVWTAHQGKLLEPLESPMGYHIVIVDHKIPKMKEKRIEIDRNKLKEEVQKGKYGYREENFTKFLDTLYLKYDASLNQAELYNVWDSIQKMEGVNSMSGIPVSMLTEVDNKVIGRIGGKEITLDWLVNETNNYSFYANVSINNGFSFNKLINDIFARHLLVQWYADNKDHFPEFDITIKRKTVNKIYRSFLEKMEELQPDISRDVILNRFMLKHGIVVNSALFAEDAN